MPDHFALHTAVQKAKGYYKLLSAILALVPLVTSVKTENTVKSRTGVASAIPEKHGDKKTISSATKQEFTSTSINRSR